MGLDGPSFIKRGQVLILSVPEFPPCEARVLDIHVSERHGWRVFVEIEFPRPISIAGQLVGMSRHTWLYPEYFR